MKTGVRTITPKDAKKLLEKNTINRQPKNGAIKRYAADMTAGRWIVNGEAIIIREDGVLLNGQNRLMACVMADVPFDTLVVEDAPAEAMDTIDIGQSRTLGDQLHWRGVKHPQTVAAAVKWMYRYDYMVAQKSKVMKTFVLPRDKEIEYFEANRELIERSAEFIIPLTRRIPGANSISIFNHFLISRHKSPEIADAFYHAVAFETENGGAALKLKDWLIDRKSATMKPSIVTTAAIHVKSARFWLAGFNPSKIAWKRTGKTLGERFPRIEDPYDYREKDHTKGDPVDREGESLEKVLAGLSLDS